MQQYGSLRWSADDAPAARHFDHVYRGTVGYDSFVGTDGADKWISGRYGYDSFDGLGGVDRAVIDYGRDENNEFFITAGSAPGSFSGSGYDEYGDGSNAFSFDNVEQVYLTGSPTQEGYLLYDLPAIGADQHLRIDGGGGGDYLTIDMGAAQTADMRFVVGNDGVARGTLGTFSGFSDYKVSLGSGDDLLVGSGGTDHLEGAGGDDVIKGGAGGDVLYGKEGADVVTGGKDADLFAFFTIDDFAIGAKLDTVTDFSGVGGEGDRIGFAYVADFTFVGAERFSGEGVAELRATPVEGGYLVRGDVDGDGRSDLAFVVVTDAPLTAEDLSAKASEELPDQALWILHTDGLPAAEHLPLA